MRRSAKLVPSTVIAVILTATSAVPAAAPDTAFTYQGRLLEGGAPANGSYEIAVGLFDAESGGSQIGATLVFEGVLVTDGLITLELDYGAEAFDDGARWVEITVDGVTLAPRQAITRAPYAIQTRGIFVDDAGNVGIGTTSPQTRLDVLRPAGQDEREVVQQVGVDDGNGDFFRIRNSTIAGGQFITQFWGHHQTDDREAFQIIASTIAEQDVGTRPVLTFDAWLSDGDELTGSFVTRPPFAWNNGTSRLMTMDAQGWLGIGTSAPITPLHIANTNPRLTLHDTNDVGKAQEGFISLVDAAGVETAWIGFVEDTNLYVRNDIGNVVIRPTGAFAVQDVPAVLENHGNQAILMSLFSDRAWSFIQEGTGNTTALKLQSIVDGDKDFIVQTDGGVLIRTHDGGERAAITTNNVGSGFVTVSRANGTRVVTVGSTSPDRGGVFVLDDDTAEGSILVNPQSGQSVVSADEKNFRVANPRDASTDIVFTCVEGPEAAVYVRGTGRLENGRAVVVMPPHFADVATAEGMTVQLTPRSARSKGLAVVLRSPARLEVRELFDGRGDYDFSWKVMAVRRGHETYRVIQPASSAGRAQGKGVDQ